MLLSPPVSCQIVTVVERGKGREDGGEGSMMEVTRFTAGIYTSPSRVRNEQRRVILQEGGSLLLWAAIDYRDKRPEKPLRHSFRQG